MFGVQGHTEELFALDSDRTFVQRLSSRGEHIFVLGLRGMGSAKRSEDGMQPFAPLTVGGERDAEWQTPGHSTRRQHIEPLERAQHDTCVAVEAMPRDTEQTSFALALPGGLAQPKPAVAAELATLRSLLVSGD